MKGSTHKTIAYILLIFISAIVVIGFSAFDQEEIEEEVEKEEVIPPLVQKALDEKIKNYQKTILDKCRKKAFEEAETYIDSLVAEELKILSRDTIRFPAKPVRPDLREPIILNDSTVISPIVK